ncbi:hypothetical protein ES703_67484 [subsurface metagenome]
MEKEALQFKRLNVEGIHPVIFQQFKLICIERNVSIKEVIHEFLNAYVDQALKEFKKKRNRVV